MLKHNQKLLKIKFWSYKETAILICSVGLGAHSTYEYVPRRFAKNRQFIPNIDFSVDISDVIYDSETQTFNISLACKKRKSMHDIVVSVEKLFTI